MKLIYQIDFSYEKDMGEGCIFPVYRTAFKDAETGNVGHVFKEETDDVRKILNGYGYEIEKKDEEEISINGSSLQSVKSLIKILTNIDYEAELRADSDIDQIKSGQAPKLN